MNEYDPLALARDLGVKLEVDADQDPLQIIAKPKEKITDELREGIKTNRDDLLRTLLFRSAGEWIASLERPFEAPDDADEALNTAWHDKDLAGFREVLRAWAKVGLEQGKEKAESADRDFHNNRVKEYANGTSAHKQPYSTGPSGYGVSPSGRNLRNYWQISTRPYPGSHYATFPPELPLRCIKAGTSEHGVCSECGAPWRRVVERKPMAVREGPGRAGLKNSAGNGSASRTAITGTMLEGAQSRTIGFEPTCSHQAETIPATVLDPFSGSGTTGLVARKLGRRSVLIDLDERNVKLLEERMGYQGVLL